MASSRGQATALRVHPVPACPVCATPGVPLHDGVPDAFGATRRTWSFRSCPQRACRHVWLDPAPDDAHLAQAYDAYPLHQSHVPAQPPRPTLAGRAYHALLAAFGVPRQRERLERYRLPRGEGQRLLELGCGNGARFAALRSRGYRVEGQDVVPAAVASAGAQGVVVHHGSLPDLGLPAASYDAVVMNHVLEHVRDPVPFLAEVRRLLAPDGRLVSIQPNGASRAHRRHGPDWVGLDPPRHLHAYTPASLRAVLQRAGFRHVRLHSTVLRAEHWERECLRRHAARTRQPLRGLNARSAAVQLAAGLRAPFAPHAGDETVVEARP